MLGLLIPISMGTNGMAGTSKMRFVNCIRAYDANFPQRCQVTNCILLMQCIKRMRNLQQTSAATIFGSIIEELLFNVVTFDVNFLFLCFVFHLNLLLEFAIVDAQECG